MNKLKTTSIIVGGIGLIMGWYLSTDIGLFLMLIALHFLIWGHIKDSEEI